MWPFDWWKPKCPVDIRQKAWVELRMRWLAEQLGMRQFDQNKIILPTEEYFPDRFDQTPEAARCLLDRVAEYVGVSPARIELLVEPQGCASEAAGPSEPGVIYLSESQLADPTSLVATFARELVRDLLFERKLIEPRPDLQWTIDLATITSGFGIFVANAPLGGNHEHGGKHSHGAGHSCSCGSKQARMPTRVMAYAMALHAWLRGEDKPAWAACLSHEPSEMFWAGLRYLVRTENSLLRPDNLHQWDKNPSLARLLDQLEQGADSQRVAVLWQLADRGPAAAEAATAIARCLVDRQPVICAEAARTLAELGQAAADAVPDIVDVLGHHDEEVRAAAAYALGKLHLRPEVVVGELAEHVCDPSMRETTAWALAQYSEQARPALPPLLAELKGELGCGDGAIDFLVYAVRAISPDAETELRQLIDSCDADLRQQADHLIPDEGPIPDPPGRVGLRF